ncbi:MAG: transcriptional repressor LexA [Planctomycetota bacterium]|nr:transcriptional repressor LexA [Planctomycetota bacterium]
MNRFLTDRQQSVYDFIRDKIINRGYGPTVREIGEKMDISSPNGVMCHLKALEKKGMIKRDANKSRAIELTESPAARAKSIAVMPLAGRVAAGTCALAEEQTETIDFAEMLCRDDRFALEVTGDSMIDAHIADGDYVVIQKQSYAYPGQIVVAQTDENEATLKYWFPENGRIRLQPANRHMKPIYVDNADIKGIVIGVVRRLR